jgi:hypothetical protein
MQNFIFKIYYPLFFLTLLFSQTLKAKVIDLDQLNIEKGVVRVGLFKKNESIKKIKEEFERDFMLLIKNRASTTVYIVNIDSIEYEKKLKEIRELYPSSYNAKREISALYKKKNRREQKRESANKMTVFADKFQKEKKIKDDYLSKTLNSRTILKVRSRLY